MRLIGLLLVLAAIAGIYNYAGNALEEKHVRELYEAQEKALLAQDGEALCKMTSEDFEMVILYRIDSHQRRDTTTREQYCKSSGQTAEQMRQLAHLMGDVPMKYKQTISDIVISPDERSATVEVRATMEMPGFRMTSRTHDTVVRKRWKTQVSRSEGTAWVGPAYR